MGGIPLRDLPCLFHLATTTECSVPTIANAGASPDTIAIDDTVTYTCNCGFAFIDADGGIMASMTVKCLTTGMLESLPVCGMFICQGHIEYFQNPRYNWG